MINYIDRMGEHCHQHNDCCEHHYREHILEGEHCEEEHGFHEILLAHIHRKNIHASIEEITDLVNGLIEEKLGSAGSVDVDSLYNELRNHLNNLPKKLSEFENDVPFLIEQDLNSKYVTFAELKNTLDDYLNQFRTQEDKYSYIKDVRKNDVNQLVIEQKLYHIDGISDTFTIDIPNNNPYILPAANVVTLGGVKLGYVNNGKNYRVQVDGNNNAFVNVPWTGGGSGSGDTVTVTPTLSSGTKIADISVNGTSKALYAPSSTSGSNVQVQPILTTGTEIAKITVNGVPYSLRAPETGSGGDTPGGGGQGGSQPEHVPYSEFETWYCSETGKTLAEVGNPDTKPTLWSKTVPETATWIALKTTIYSWDLETSAYVVSSTQWSIWMTRATVDSIDWNGVDEEISRRIADIIATYTELSAEDIRELLNAATLITDLNSRVTGVESKVHELEEGEESLKSQYATLKQGLDDAKDKIEINRSVIEQTANSITSTVGQWRANNILSDSDKVETSDKWTRSVGTFHQGYDNYAVKNPEHTSCTAILEVILSGTTNVSEDHVYTDTWDIYYVKRTYDENAEGEDKYKSEVCIKSVSVDLQVGKKHMLTMIALDNVDIGPESYIAVYAHGLNSVYGSNVEYAGLSPLFDADKMSVIRQLQDEIDLLLKNDDKYAGIMLYFDENGGVKDSFINLLADNTIIASKVTEITGDILAGGQATIKGSVTAKEFSAQKDSQSMMLNVTNDQVQFCNNVGLPLAYFKYENNTMYLYIWDEINKEWKVCDLAATGWKSAETIIVHTQKVSMLQRNDIDPNRTLTYDDVLYLKDGIYYSDYQCTIRYSGDCVVRVTDEARPVLYNDYDEPDKALVVQCKKYILLDISNGEASDSLNYIYSTKNFIVTNNTSVTFGKYYYWCSSTPIENIIQVYEQSNPLYNVYNIGEGSHNATYILKFDSLGLDRVTISNFSSLTISSSTIEDLADYETGY